MTHSLNYQDTDGWEVFKYLMTSVVYTFVIGIGRHRCSHKVIESNKEPHLKTLLKNPPDVEDVGENF